MNNNILFEDKKTKLKIKEMGILKGEKNNLLFSPSEVIDLKSQKLSNPLLSKKTALVYIFLGCFILGQVQVDYFFSDNFGYFMIFVLWGLGIASLLYKPTTIFTIVFAENGSLKFQDYKYNDKEKVDSFSSAFSTMMIRYLSDKKNFDRYKTIVKEHNISTSFLTI